MRDFISRLRNSFHRPQRFIEVIGPSHQRQVMTQAEYIAKTISENRLRANLAPFGFLIQREPKHVIEHVMRRWMI